MGWRRGCVQCVRVLHVVAGADGGSLQPLDLGQASAHHLTGILYYSWCVNCRSLDQLAHLGMNGLCMILLL